MRLPDGLKTISDRVHRESVKRFEMFLYQDMILIRILNYIYNLAIPLYIYKLPIIKLEMFFFLLIL